MTLKTHEMFSFLEAHDFTSQQADALVAWQTRIIAATGDGRSLKSWLLIDKSDLKDVKRSLATTLIVANVTGALLTVAAVWILLL